MLPFEEDAQHFYVDIMGRADVSGSRIMAIVTRCLSAKEKHDRPLRFKGFDSFKAALIAHTDKLMSTRKGWLGGSGFMKQFF